ncbi:hypothetical protein [Streptomyces sp. HUAS TT7]|uniref:hypothetical protein n=1 Tax=Streptomyces sp. HUAS TT7 TaxID=3447507 RepID=UPI003F65F73F
MNEHTEPAVSAPWDVPVVLPFATTPADWADALRMRQPAGPRQALQHPVTVCLLAAVAAACLAQQDRLLAYAVVAGVALFLVTLLWWQPKAFVHSAPDAGHPTGG